MGSSKNRNHPVDIGRNADTQFFTTLDDVLEFSIALTGADFGNIQILNAEGTGLEIVAQHGFKKEFLDHFKFVPLEDTSTACGFAARMGKRISIEDVEANPFYTPHREIARGVPFRAVQSTPLYSGNGKLLGMLSTHYREPQLPDEQKLHILDLYARQAACLIEQLLDREPLIVNRSGNDAFASEPGTPETYAAAIRHKESFDMIWKLPFFADLSSEQKNGLLKVATFRQMKKGRNLFLHNDAFTHIYWVCNGAIQIYRLTPDGRELTSDIATTGDSICARDAMRGIYIYHYNARAIYESTLLAIPIDWILKRAESNWDHLGKHFMRRFARQAQDARIEAEHRTTFTITQNIACYLQHLCVLHNFDTRGFILPYSKKLIASRLGVELESLSRALPKLRKFGIVMKGKYVSFSNLTAIQNMSCGVCHAATECPTRKTLIEKSNTPPAGKKPSKP